MPTGRGGRAGRGGAARVTVRVEAGDEAVAAPVAALLAVPHRGTALVRPVRRLVAAELGEPQRHADQHQAHRDGGGDHRLGDPARLGPVLGIGGFGSRGEVGGGLDLGQRPAGGGGRDRPGRTGGGGRLGSGGGGGGSGGRGAGGSGRGGGPRGLLRVGVRLGVAARLGIGACLGIGARRGRGRDLGRSADHSRGRRRLRGLAGHRRSLLLLRHRGSSRRRRRLGLLLECPAHRRKLVPTRRLLPRAALFLAHRRPLPSTTLLPV